MTSEQAEPLFLLLGIGSLALLVLGVLLVVSLFIRDGESGRRIVPITRHDQALRDLDRAYFEALEGMQYAVGVR